LTVSTEAQASELSPAWRQIVAGKQPRKDALERDQVATTARALALAALETIESAIRQNTATGRGVSEVLCLKRL
jgi:hypothetical protein